MIPTVIIINCDSPEVNSYATVFENFTRVLYRTSFQGEQLYGIFEGIVYVSPSGDHEVKRQDNYEGMTELILKKLNNLRVPEQAQLKGYLTKKDNQSPQSRLHFLGEFEDGKIPKGFQHDSEVFEFMEKYFVE